MARLGEGAGGESRGRGGDRGSGGLFLWAGEGFFGGAGLSFGAELEGDMDCYGNRTIMYIFEVTKETVPLVSEGAGPGWGIGSRLRCWSA